MCCGEGSLSPEDYKEIQDPTVVKARKALLEKALGSMNYGASPFPANTPVAAGTNALRRNSSNLMNAMMTGKPYTSAQPGTYGNLVDSDFYKDLYGRGYVAPEDEGGKGGGDDIPGEDDPRKKRRRTTGYFDPYDIDNFVG